VIPLLSFAELRLNAVEHRIDADSREGLRHSVEYMKEAAVGGDEKWTEQAIAALEDQLRREMSRRS
jgi:hypothetical protein